MSLVLRRAAAARSLLAAAGALALIATLLLTGLAAYSTRMVAAGTAGTIEASAPGERSVLVRGSGGRDAAAFAERDAAVRERFANGLGGRPVGVVAAGYASGRALGGDTGDAVPDQGGLVYASVGFFEDLAAHAELTAGAWPQPGKQPQQTAVGEGAARVLGLAPGDRVPVVDRVSEKTTVVVVSGVWRPRSAGDPYWRLAPDVAGGVLPGSATYGPFAVGREDFDRSFATGASAAWVAAVDLTGADVAGVRRAATAATAEEEALPDATGLGTSATVEAAGPAELAGRLENADLVGRSALVTPILLVSVLSGLALVLVAALLTEHRRAESALLRARGATNVQLAGFGAAEAAALVLPAALVAPPLAAAAVHFSAARGWFGLRAYPGWGPEPQLWFVAVLAAAGCALAITLPVVRGGTYVSEMAARSRPGRRAFVQRAGADLLLVALAVLGWLQLRQYSSPLSAGSGAGLGIDPLLAAAPTIGILAGATLALRLLQPASRLAERRLGRGTNFSALFGIWQAGRRPHAGPVLLLALAVAAGTVGWCLAGTARQSVNDQADHEVGADLRLVETGNAAPDSRPAALATLPGATAIVPAWRESLQPPTPGSASVDLIAIDAEELGRTVRIRDDLYDGGPAALTEDLTRRRPADSFPELPAGDRLTGRASLTGSAGSPSLTAVLLDATGAQVRVPLEQGSFSVALPAVRRPLRLAGFQVTASGGEVELVLSGVAVGGRPLPFAGAWQAAAPAASLKKAETGPGSLRVLYPGGSTTRLQFTVTPDIAIAEVPVVVTAAARAALRFDDEGETRLRMGGTTVPVQVVGTIAAVPGTQAGGALLVDRPTLQAYLLGRAGLPHGTQEWWIATGAGDHTAAAAAATRLGGLDVLDRRAIGAASAVDAYGLGGRTALLVAAIGALLLAAAGILVDVRTTARRRISELAVLDTLGAGPVTLARSLMTEQAFLAGTGVLAGLAVGIGVAATMAPLLILTPAATRPIPEPVLVVDWWRAGGTAALLLVLALTLSALTGATLRRRLAPARLKLGADR
ncbi:FtsX-like permease family protein [Symbioplanes lichenis]|uniref:FtsX-like permease family protein n=1 Tax=Symbioplanes lichenis TaxID=1629072 RepID=UPI002738ADBD|nr:FtsX-like permease family protein [Actinoplanes lichenis]